jgi:hypothetical protein
MTLNGPGTETQRIRVASHNVAVKLRSFVSNDTYDGEFLVDSGSRPSSLRIPFSVSRDKTVLP